MVDFLLVPSYLKDNFDVIRLFDEKWRYLVKEDNANDTLYTWDIKKFYPSISFQLIRNAMRYRLESYPHLLHTKFSQAFVYHANCY